MYIVTQQGGHAVQRGSGHAEGPNLRPSNVLPLMQDLQMDNGYGRVIVLITVLGTVICSRVQISSGFSPGILL